MTASSPDDYRPGCCLLIVAGEPRFGVGGPFVEEWEPTAIALHFGEDESEYARHPDLHLATLPSGNRVRAGVERPGQLRLREIKPLPALAKLRSGHAATQKSCASQTSSE